MPRFQFSMRWLMLLITVVCIALFALVTFDELFDLLLTSFIWCILPTPLIVLAIYGKDGVQAFAVGALVPWATVLVLRIPGSVFSALGATIWLLPMSAICGALAFATWRWIKTNWPG